MNETASTVAKEIFEPKIVWIVSLKVLNGIFGNGCCTQEVADAHKTRFDQIKSQTRIQYWNTREITDDKNKKVGLKKKSRTIVQISFLCPSPKHTQKRNKTSHITTYSESSSSSSSSSEFLACLIFLCFLCTTSWSLSQFFLFGLSGAFLFPF